MEASNTEAMREALKSVAAWLLERFGNPADPDHDKAEQFYILITGVLAAPARNCDVGTVEAQVERIVSECKRHAHCTSCPVHAAWGKFRKGKPKLCQLVWAQLPYKERGDHA